MNVENGENPEENDAEERLVNYLLTNPPDHTYTEIRRLVSKVFTYYPIIPGVIDSPGLVNYLLTNLKGKKGQILLYTDEHPVFLQSNIWRTLDVTKQYTNTFIKELISLNLVKKTKYTVIPPISNLGGRRPQIYTLSNIELNGSNDPRIQEARNKYYETFTRYDRDPSKSTQNIISIDILSQLVVDKYSQQGRVGVDKTPPKQLILTYMKTLKEADGLDATTLLKMTGKIYSTLSFMKPPRSPSL